MKSQIVLSDDLQALDEGAPHPEHERMVRPRMGDAGYDEAWHRLAV